MNLNPHREGFFSFAENQWFLPKERVALPDGGSYLSAEDLEFWDQKPPQEIILATGSIRKALMFFYQLSGFQFPGLENDSSPAPGFGQREISKKPSDLETFFSKKIFNGNGALKEKTFLGYLYGVPVYADPSDGETAANEPRQEAINKVQALAKKYQGQNVLVVATDTVDRPDSRREPLGKPMNEPGFPQKENFLSEDNDDEYQIAVRQFLEAYKLANYADAQMMIHVNAMAILDALSGRIVELSEPTVELKVLIDHQALANTIPSLDMGGGGMTQKFVDWQDIKKILSYMDELMRKEMQGLDKNAILWALYCQIAGMPFYAIKAQLKETNQKRQNIINQ